MKQRWNEYLSNDTPEWSKTPGWEKFNEWKKPEPAIGYRKLAEENGFSVLQSKVQNNNLITSFLPRYFKEREIRAFHGVTGCL